MQRFFYPGSLAGQHDVRLTDEQAHQLLHVLRSQPGDAVHLFDGQGEEYSGSIRELSLRACVVRLEAHVVPRSEPQTKLFLYQALLKRDKLEWVVQKATELGVAAIHLVQSRYCDRKGVPRLDRLAKIAQEAAEQSGRCTLPTLEKPASLADAVAQAVSRHDACLFAWEQEKAHLLPEVLGGLETSKSIAIFIGPEGGWNDEEVHLACQSCIPVSLGNLVLRAETAAIAAVSASLLILK